MGSATATGAFAVLTVMGTIAFAVSGVLAAAEAAMDWLGALVLAVVVAIGGGTMRDVLIGNLPVTWVRDPDAVIVACATAAVGIAVLRRRPAISPRWRAVYVVADAVGLAAFVVLGASIALDHGVSAPIAVAMGAVTGVGGGVVRDVFTARRPMVLVGEIYAVAGLGGAVAYVLLDALGAPSALAVWPPVAAIVAVRLLAVRGDWHLPRTLPESDGAGS